MKTWNDLINVQRRVLIPSPRLNNLTNRIARNNRKKLIDITLVLLYIKKSNSYAFFESTEETISLKLLNMSTNI